MIFGFFMGVLATLATEFALAHLFNYIGKKDVAKAEEALLKAKAVLPTSSPQLIKKIEKWVDDEATRAEIFMRLKQAPVETPIPAANTESVPATPAQ